MKSVTENSILAIKVLYTLEYLETIEDLSLDEIVEGIFGLTSSIKDFDPDDFTVEDGEPVLKEYSATGYMVDRLQNAYLENRLREQYEEELEAEQKFELLDKIKLRENT
jgi:hypothetical protein